MADDNKQTYIADLTEESDAVAEGGEEPMDIDAALKETGQAPDAPQDDLITAPVDASIHHLDEEAKDE